VALWHFT